MIELINQRHDELKNHKYYFTIRYIACLVILLIFWLCVLYLLKCSKFKINLPSIFVPYLSYGYMFSYSVTAGLLVYGGIDQLNDFNYDFFQTSTLSGLATVSLILWFSLIYSTIFKQFLSILFNVKIKIDPIINIIAFGLGKIFIVSSLYLITVKRRLNKGLKPKDLGYSSTKKNAKRSTLSESELYDMYS